MPVLQAEGLAFVAYVLVALTGVASTAAAQTAPTVTPIVQNVSRFESWSFLEPSRADADSDYSLFSNRTTLGIHVDTRRLTVDGAFQYAQLYGLPRRATGPGPLGPGGMYFAAARTPQAYQLYFKSLSFGVKEIIPGLSLTVGRMRFSSGLEAQSRTPKVEAIKRERVSGRLIGEVEWSAFERAFDGARLDLDRSGWHATTALLFPTQGGFEESANPTMSSVRVASAAVTRQFGYSEIQIFAHHYQDGREVNVRPDNSLLPATRVDIGLATAGVSHIGVYLLGSGHVDSVVWIAGQLGDWYDQRQRSYSAIVEGGYQWPGGWRPWLRAGAQYASGDPDPRDNRHSTFFPMLPSTRPDFLASTFAQMNLRDVFGQIRLHAADHVVIGGEIHRLWLANAADRWYSGTGATARRGEFFLVTSAARLVWPPIWEHGCKCRLKPPCPRSGR